MENQPTPHLTEAELKFLAFALDLAADQMADRSDEFDEADEASLENLRRMATQKTFGHATVLETTNVYAKPTLRVLTPNEHDRAWHAIEGAAGAPDADPGTILNAVLHALRIEAPTAEDEQAKCAKCRRLFDPAEPRTRRAHQPEMAYCRGCVDACHDTEIADHRCVICA